MAYICWVTGDDGAGDNGCSATSILKYRSESILFAPFALLLGKRLPRMMESPWRSAAGPWIFLVALDEQAGEAVSAGKLIRRAWPHAAVDIANLRVHVAALRKALSDRAESARFIALVSRRGSVFVAAARRSVPVPVPDWVKGSRASSVFR